MTRTMQWARRCGVALVMALLLAGLAAPADAQVVKISNAAASAAANAVVDLVDSGPGAGKFVLYTACPTNVDDAPSGTVLAELTFASTAFGAASNGVATAASITADSSANASGTAACFRWLDGSNVAYVQGDVGTSGAALNLVTTTIVAGQPVQVTSTTFTIPKS